MASAAFPWAFRAGALVPHDQLVIHAESLAMRYALSAFEGVRGYADATGRVRLFALDEHLARLAETLALAALPAIPAERVLAAVEQVVTANHPQVDCYLRIAVNMTSLGTLKSEASGELFISLQPMARKDVPPGGISVAISARRKPSDDAFPQRAKLICNYAGPRLAYLEARAAGFDDVILRGPEGQLSEAPTANLFVIRDGALATPRIEDGILAGITRRHVLELARRLGYEVSEQRLSAEDAHAADEAFLCGTGLELAPIARFDDRPLPGERRIFPRLVEAYFARVRGDAGAA
jgi:branched-chain amino acid aminotransferase